MSYIDIALDETVFPTDENGDFLLVNREVDIAADVILSSPGDIKYAPTVGGNAYSFLLSITRQGVVIQRAFEVALRAAGFSSPVVDVSNFPDEVSVNNDVVLTSNT